MTETRETRIKRLKMRSMRRGIKEMDIILSAYSEHQLDAMDGDSMDLYEVLLQENDHDLYQWISGQVPPPARFEPLISQISQGYRK